MTSPAPHHPTRYEAGSPGRWAWMKEGIVENCSRCGKGLLPGHRLVADPCCGAPDCDRRDAVSHFECLPAALQLLEIDG
jgi:uncharacterized protein (DUF983 family)